MKKFFEDAELELVKFSNADVITTSELPVEPDPGVNVPGDDF